MPDGEHAFTVAAIDGQGQVLAQSAITATVTEQHWPLSVALSLFACGFVVLVAYWCKGHVTKHRGRI